MYVGMVLKSVTFFFLFLNRKLLVYAADGETACGKKELQECTGA